MSKNQLIFKIIEYNPTIQNIDDYYYIISCNDTKFKDYIYCSQNNEIIDKTNLNKSLKYIIKLTKNGKVLGVGNLNINQSIFAKKVKKKIFNNINLFITENNYKKIFPQANANKLRSGILLSIELNIKYNIIDKYLNEKQKSPTQKKIKLIKRNLSFQKNEYSVKSTNNYLTTSTSNINTYNNINSGYDSDNFGDTNLNCFSSEKLSNIANSYALSPIIIKPPFSEPNLKKKKRKIIKKGIISSISFKYNPKKNKKFKIFSNNIKNNIYNIKNRIKLTSSRNKKFIFNKNKINAIMTQNSSSSKTSNSKTHSSAIDSALIEEDNYCNIININRDKKNKKSNLNFYNDIFIYNINSNKYNQDNDEVDSFLLKIENKKKNILKAQEKINLKFYTQEKMINKLNDALNNYDYKIKNNKFIIDNFKEKKELLKYKNEII